MEFKGTPAPWVTAEFLDGFNIKDEKHGRHIAFIPKKHNANLIAAAPELLEALQLIVSYHDDGNEGLHREDLAMARKSIAKALSQQ